MTRAAPALDRARRGLSACGVCSATAAEAIASLDTIQRGELARLAQHEANAEACRVKAQEARDLIAELLSQGGEG